MKENQRAKVPHTILVVQEFHFIVLGLREWIALVVFRGSKEKNNELPMNSLG